VEQTIIRACTENASGVSQEDIQKALSSGVTQEELLKALQALMARGKVVVCPGVNGKTKFRLQSDEDVAKLSGLDAQDRLVYQEVERAGSSGISTKDLCNRANLKPNQLTLVLKTLETRKLVKPVKSHAAKNKKMYLLYNLEASKEITGGTFYSGQEFDHELVTQLQQASIAIITREDDTTVAKVHDWVEKSGLVRGKQLEIGAIRQVLDTLVYDGRLEKSRDPLAPGDDKFSYRLAQQGTMMEGLVKHFTSVPTGCECLACTTDLPGESCPTMSRWLDVAIEESR